MSLDIEQKEEILAKVAELIKEALNFDETATENLKIVRGQSLAGLGFDSIIIQHLLMEIADFYDLEEIELDAADTGITVGQVVDEVEKMIESGLFKKPNPKK